MFTIFQMLLCLQVLATMLSSIPSTTRGPAQIVMFDIHALQERFYFSDHVIPRYELEIIYGTMYDKQQTSYSISHLLGTVTVLSLYLVGD